MKVLKFDIQRFVETIEGTEGHDNISVTAEQQFINALGGNDTIFNAFTHSYEVNYSFVTISGGDGADSIKSGSSNLPTNAVSISGGLGNDWVSVVGSNATIGGDEGDDYIVARNNNNSINGGAGDDNIVGEGSNITILAENGNDTVYVGNSSYALIEGGDGEDSLIAGGTHSYDDDGGIGVTINGGNGNDYLRAKNNTNGSMIGGLGNDTIVAMGSPQNLTIEGGEGNDLISLASGVTALIYYNSADENDIVYGFNADDTLQIVGNSYSTVAADNDVIVTSGDGSVTLVGATSYALNIQGALDDNPVTPTVPVDDTYYVYRGGNDTIWAKNPSVSSSYTTYEQINLAADYVGFDIDDDNIYIHSSSGTLTIKDTRDRDINFGAGTDTTPVMYSYIEKNSTVSNSSGNYFNIINGRRRESMFGILIGGDNVNDLIYAGAGGSSMWGGNNSNDTLVGGAGYDEFVYKLGSGNDIIQGADEKDFIRLKDVTVSQITAVSTSAGEISANFSDGGSIKIEGTASVRIELEKWVIAFDHTSQTWYVA